MLAYCGLPLVKKAVNMSKIPQVKFSPSAYPCLVYSKNLGLKMIFGGCPVAGRL